MHVGSPEFMAEIEKEEAKVNRQCHLSEDGSAIILTRPNGYEVGVDINRIADAPKLLGWILHLSGKVWVTVPMLRRFIEIASKANNITINRKL
jgi:hypothetical protein